MLKKLAIGLFFFFLAFGLFSAYQFLQNPQDEQVKSGQAATKTTFVNILPTPTPTPTPVSTPTPLPSQKPVTRAKTLTVALLGDSMIQTMGEATLLKNLLEESLPEDQFKILNFGVGSTSIETAPGRIPQILSQKPDIVVVDSFAYNHSAITLDQQWQLLIQIVDSFKAENVKVILLANIAPNSKIYAKGIEGINWSDEERRREAERTRSFLVNIIRFAQGSKLPLADAYTASLGADGEGKTIYIETGSNLHPSPEGHSLVYQKITEAVEAIFRKQ